MHLFIIICFFVHPAKRPYHWPTPLGDLQLKVSFNICTLKQMYCSLIALFIYLSEENLRAALGKMGVGGRSMDEVMDKVRNKHYQVTVFLPWL